MLSEMLPGKVRSQSFWFDRWNFESGAMQRLLRRNGEKLNRLLSRPETIQCLFQKKVAASLQMLGSLSKCVFCQCLICLLHTINLPHHLKPKRIRLLLIPELTTLAHPRLMVWSINVASHLFP